MSRWQRVKIGDFARSGSAKAASASNLPVYSVTKHDGFVPSDDYFRKQIYSKNTGGYRIVRKGHFGYATIHLDEGAIGYAPEDCLISPMYTVFEVDENRANIKYLYRLLKSPLLISSYSIIGTGSVHRRKSIPFERFASLEIPLPSIAEQERIAGILDQADGLRRLRQRAIDRLDSLGQAIFHEMFGDLTTNQKGWRSEGLDALITEGPQNGLYKPSSMYGQGTRILRIDAFYDGRVTKQDNLKRLSVAEDELRVYGLNRNDIVINRVNSTEHLGKSAIIPDLTEPMVFESNMMRFRVDEKQIDPRYLISFLQTKFLKAQIGRRTKDAVNQSSINQQDVKSFIVRIPPLDLQQRFVELSEASELSARTLRAGFDKAALLFSSLQDRAFRGEL
ncbi:restriction endonuclease subunit S [uncultured Thiodictyon sp.]|uniref:restriction endonuclease subunit S n=1 Tax=uncultured Thiodictyon sp. TaxID=1846217 RepID=UPI0025DA9554|nr:restriction endonuclease subunit S [uncultured Thiodictyon sp.]